MNSRPACFFLLIFSIALGSCANISAPTGGKKDKIPPKLQSVSPADSLKNTRVNRIELQFDEYVTVGDVQKEVHIMPMLAVDPTLTAVNKHVVLKIVDSLLEDNTTYRISFGNAIKDLHEGNPFSNYTYTFSTGGYFDSLSLKGSVISAATGLPDTGIIVVLYNATENDSAIVKKKPKYVTKVDSKGEFLFKGLPAHSFRIYAVKDANTNYIYDGTGDEVAFNDANVVPGIDSTMTPVKLRLFAEIPDTATAAKKKSEKPGMDKGTKTKGSQKTDTNFTYAVNVDTSSPLKRTFDINKSVKITFNRQPFINQSKIELWYDSASNRKIQPYKLVTDTLHPDEAVIQTVWKENKLYKLALDSAFATDTGGKAAHGATYAFRTFNQDDYGKITIHLPSKYYGAKPDYNYLLLVRADNDTVYQQPVFDTVVNLLRAAPATYTFRIIADKNKNGKWDTGDLLGRKQPEEVIPSSANIKLKAGWEHSIDFEEKPKPTDKNKKPGMQK